MTIAPPNNQITLELGVQPIWNASNNASARNAYGAAAQEIACRTFGLDPIPINGNFEVCLDAKKNETFYEIKSVNIHGKLVLYDWRINKEQDAGVPINYCVVVHHRKGGRRDVLSWILSRKVIIIVCPMAVIHRLAMACPLNKPTSPEKHNKRNGYMRKGYCDGYRNLPVNKLISQMTSKQQIESPFGFKLFDLLTP
jgi:hypothetical protein